MLKFSLVLAAIVAAPMPAGASCIKNAEAKIQSYGVGDIFSEFSDEGGKEVVIYKRESSNDFLAVEGDGTCIRSIRAVDKDELSLKYGIEDESECEECAGVMEGDEDLSLSADAEEPVSDEATEVSISEPKKQPDVSAVERTAFRGLRLGMAKEQAMAVALKGFSTSYQEGISLDSGLSTSSFVNFVNEAGESCAALKLSKEHEMVEKLTMQECFFGSRNASLDGFARQFAESYMLSSLKRGLGQVTNGIEEYFEGTSLHEEAIKISKKTVHHKSHGRFVLPIQVDVEAPFEQATFD